MVKVQKLQDGDEEVDIMENFTDKSYEINCLYVTFSKMANVLKYANNAFFEFAKCVLFLLNSFKKWQ